MRVEAFKDGERGDSDLSNRWSSREMQPRVGNAATLAIEAGHGHPV